MSVCMIPIDASHEEAVEWIVFSIEQLTSLCNEIFERLSNRMKNFAGHIDRVQLDLRRVAMKIEQVREMNDAVVICAPGKFIETGKECQQSILSSRLLANVNALKIKAKREYDLNKSKDTAVVLNGKQAFYLLIGRGMKRNKQTRQIPHNLQSAADLLLFNTTLNVYADNRFMDPFENVKIESNVESEYKMQQLASIADDSILSVSVNQASDPLQYQPDFGSVQNFSLPELLFTSINFFADSHAVRKPSGKDISSTESEITLVMEKNINESEISVQPKLDMVENAASIISEKVALESQFFTTETDEVHKTSSEAMKQHRSPSTKTSEIVNSATSNNEKKNPPLLSSPPPPPPAPPPPPLLQLTAQTTVSSHSKPKIAFNDDRANLMDAIRRAGGAKGAKLRSVRKQEDILDEDTSVLPKRNVSAPSSSDDLMSSLAKALDQRRKGIFGVKSEHRGSVKSIGLSEGAFAHISARIPPPAPKAESDENDNDKIDDEWE